MIDLFSKTAYECSELITKAYSTSFSLGIRTLNKKYHGAIYAIYGFVRYADEIVDTFHDHDKKELLERFTKDTYQAIDEKISLNPVLHSFQLVVNQYNIDTDLIDAFLFSMEMDLDKSTYEDKDYKTYIYGSAEVVGLMCLYVFCEGNQHQYDTLVDPAKSLGSAFQKVNFLRDIKSDFDDRGRVYFPKVDFEKFSIEDKEFIEEDIRKDFLDAIVGIRNLPNGARAGVYLAYVYYISLFKKITKLSPSKIKEERIRIPNTWKFILLLRSYFFNRINRIV